MSQMIAELLDLARIESGMADLDLATVDLNQVVAPAADRLRAQADRHEVTLELATETEPLPVHADPDRTARVVMSLVHNAIKFTPPSGSIRVSTHRTDDEAIISVSDSGAGLALDELDRVFERFYKADPSRTGAGAGLGLSIARHTVRQHGGRIWAQSPASGAAQPSASPFPSGNPLPSRSKRKLKHSFNQRSPRLTVRSDRPPRVPYVSRSRGKRPDVKQPASAQRLARAARVNRHPGRSRRHPNLDNQTGCGLIGNSATPIHTLPTPLWPSRAPHAAAILFETNPNGRRSHSQTAKSTLTAR